MKNLNYLFAALLSFQVAAANAADNAAAAFGNTQCQLPVDLKPALNAYINNFSFEAGIPYCDTGGDRCSAAIRNWLAVHEFSQGHYAEAEKYFSEAEAFEKKNGIPKGWQKKKGWGAVADIRRYLQKRKALGEVAPEFVQKIRVIYVGQTRAKLEGSSKLLSYDAAPCRFKHLELNFGMLKQYLELFSNGRLSIMVDYQYVAGTMNRLSRRGQGQIDSIVPRDEHFDELMRDAAANFDLLWFVYPYKGGSASATVRALNLDATGKNKTRMRQIFYPDAWSRFDNFPQFFHEYLHTVEFTTGKKLTSHGAGQTAAILAETGLASGASGETDFAEWHFANSIPGSLSWQELFGRPVKLSGTKSPVDEVDESAP